MNIDDRPTTDRPQGPFTHFAKVSNGHSSATRQPIQCRPMYVPYFALRL